ncbi:arsenate reductase family protein [Facilibium subflavum]|uniref:arsenate reductase family protein n=1 Tax=Facilibium subflavum TaxID=2219058 RepID=UPI000E655352|nr:arsenate reductase family protein [Facilibium subflavum]
MYTLYHNPRCSKSRAALEYLQHNNIDVKVHEYLKSPLTHDELLRLYQKLNQPIVQMIRINDDAFKAMGLKLDTLGVDQGVEILCDNPVLLQRPILEGGNFAVIGRPLENIIEALNLSKG